MRGGSGSMQPECSAARASRDNAPTDMRLRLVLMCACAVAAGPAARAPPDERAAQETRKMEIYDGVYLGFPRGGRNSSNLMSLDIDLGGASGGDESEGRGRRKRFMQRILPLFIMPFIIQAAIVPLFLSVLKFMLVKALMVGKTALLLIVLNAFRQSNAFKGRFEQRMADQHYGYHGNGMEEYGVYIN